MSEQLKEAQEQLKEAEGAEERDEGLIAVLSEKVAYLADAEEAAKESAKRSSSKEKADA